MGARETSADEGDIVTAFLDCDRVVGENEALGLDRLGRRPGPTALARLAAAGAP